MKSEWYALKGRSKHFSRLSGLILLVVLAFSCKTDPAVVTSFGAVIRGDTTKKNIALVFTGDGFCDGGEFVAGVLKEQNIKASFFLTGNFYRNREFEPVIRKLKDYGNYLGSHSDKHLLYCDWTKRDSLLVSREEFINDIQDSYAELKKYRITPSGARYFLPPYEWYNDSIASWTRNLGFHLINFTPGTGSNADYTYPEMGTSYVDSKTIYNSILKFENQSPAGMNGFILLIHIGTDPRRTDKFYFYLPALIKEIKSRGYQFVRIDKLLD
jgi:peptidoglycan/xylan/chitin deacetylase (PgdA/CDA1 family)